ncbi:alcohol dehydrogenase [Meredithblackwellia eburnea MCA 4105]
MPFKTQAYVLAEKDAPFVLQDVELEDPQPNEVLVEIKACGLCHTDLCIQNGAFPSPFPCTTGHEGAGKVVSVGSAVTRCKPGDSVLLSFSYCNECASCKTDHPAGCEKFGEINFGRVRNSVIGNKPGIKGPKGEDIFGAFFGQSAFAKHTVVVENSVVKVPSGTDLTTLAPLGCGFQTGAGSVINVLKPEKKTSIAVFGIGAVGMGAVFAAAYLGVETIIVVDLVPERLELAKKLGATHSVNGKDSDVVAQIKKLTPYNAGAAYAVEATGNVRVLKTAHDALANRGHLLSCGTPGPGHAIPFEIHDNLLASKTYTGLTEGDSNPVEFVPFLIKLFEEGKFPVDKISKTYTIDEFDHAVHAMHSGEVIKPIIVFN